MIFSDQVFVQYNVDLKHQEKLFLPSNQNYPLNIGDGWNEQEKTKMLLYLVSYFARDFF